MARPAIRTRFGVSTEERGDRRRPWGTSGAGRSLNCGPGLTTYELALSWGVVGNRNVALSWRSLDQPGVFKSCDFRHTRWGSAPRAPAPKGGPPPGCLRFFVVL